MSELKAQRKYPVYFFKSDTTGEKDFEEFYTDGETLDLNRFDALGVIKNEAMFDESKLQLFTNSITELRSSGVWSRTELINLFNTMIPEFNHKETGRFLDGRMIHESGITIFLAERFGFLKKHAKGTPLISIFHQIILFFFDGTDFHITSY